MFGPMMAIRLDSVTLPWLRISGVNTNGAAAKVSNFNRLGKRYAMALLDKQN